MKQTYVYLILAICVGCSPAVPNSGYNPKTGDNAILPVPVNVSQETLEPVSTSTEEALDQNASTFDHNLQLSDENDFDAVSERQTIESDAERLERNRALYTLVSPKALPTRSGTNIPNVVEYALQTTNPVGEPLYARFIKSQSRFERNCAKYVSDSAAQEAFLINGGPENDRYGMDPDGDGFACRWDPTSFRRAVGRN